MVSSQLGVLVGAKVMNIAILNGGDLNEAQLERLRKLGSVTDYGTTVSESECIERLKGDDEKSVAREQVSGFDERDGIESEGFFNFAAVMLLLFIVALASTSTFEVPILSALGMGFVALSFGVIMLMRFKSSVDAFYAKLDRQRQDIEDSGAEALIVIAAEHFANFFMNNMPAFCIGIGER